MKVYIGEKIKRDTIKDVYCVHVESMSGDADAYDKNLKYFRPEEMNDLLKELEIMVYFLKLPHNAKCRDKVFRPLIEAFGLTIGIGNAMDIFAEYSGYDVFSEGELATPQEIWVTWFDSSGAEYDAGIELNTGKYVTQKLSEFYLR